MFRPLTMSQPVYFRAKTFEGGTPNNKTELKDIKNNAEDLRQKSMKEKVQNAFLIGTAVGTLLSGAGTSLYKNYEMESMLNEMATEVAEDNVDSLEIKDITKDKFPDIILHGKDGASTVYDIKHNDAFISMDNELIEIDR